MSRVRLIIEYDGAPYAGYQRQANQLTVQSELEDAILIVQRQAAKRCGIDAQFSPIIRSSGRTDSGVHSIGQIVAFDWPAELAVELDSTDKLEKIRRALDGITRPELAIKRAEFVRADFDPRRRVVCKQYSFHILNREGSPGYHRGRVWWVRSQLDIPEMILAAKKFKGTHDFTSFRAGDCVAKNPLRTILLSEFVRLSEDRLVYIVRGTGFLKHMVRILAGTLVAVGKRQLKVDQIDSIFEARHRTAAPRTAPAQGLVLDWVRYPEESAIKR